MIVLKHLSTFQNTSSKTKPDHAPKSVINRPEEIPLPKVVPLRVNSTRLNQKADPNIDSNVLEQIKTLTSMFIDKKAIQSMMIQRNCIKQISRLL